MVAVEVGNQAVDQLGGRPDRPLGNHPQLTHSATPGPVVQLNPGTDRIESPPPVPASASRPNTTPPKGMDLGGSLDTAMTPPRVP